MKGIEQFTEENKIKSRHLPKDKPKKKRKRKDDSDRKPAVPYKRQKKYKTGGSGGYRGMEDYEI